jgi:hypothetical protein
MQGGLPVHIRLPLEQDECRLHMSEDLSVDQQTHLLFGRPADDSRERS